MQVRPFIIAALLVVPGILPSQSPMIETIEIPLEFGSGPVQNPTRASATVWSQALNLPAVSSYRLRLGLVELNDPRDAVVVTNVLDGQIQRLDRNVLRGWDYLTGWFNGADVVVALELAPGSSGSVQVEAAVAFPGQPVGIDDICFGDDRVPSGSVPRRRWPEARSEVRPR